MPDSHIGQEISDDFLAQWLVDNLAPTIMGSKPATILTLADTRIHSLLHMWRQKGHIILAGTIIRYRTLYHGAEKETILFYRTDKLDQCIRSIRNKLFLRQMGYPVNQGVEACLDFLADRFQACCPHEVGILLGIPLKDVLGFMGRIDLPLSCRSEWCIYGKPEKSLAVIEAYMVDRCAIEKLVVRGCSPYQILRGTWEEHKNAV